MKPFINLEENIGKVVGHRQPPSDPLNVAGDTKESKRAWRRAFGPLGIPKGVFRFRTHEEADAWLWKKLTSRLKTTPTR